VSSGRISVIGRPALSPTFGRMIYDPVTKHATLAGIQYPSVDTLAEDI
jgi:hypothetical protein